MPINLSKGQKVDLTKGNAGLDSILAGLGWDTNKYDGGHEFDLDVSVFMTATVEKWKPNPILFSITTHRMPLAAWSIPVTTVPAQAKAMMNP